MDKQKVINLITQVIVDLPGPDEDIQEQVDMLYEAIKELKKPSNDDVFIRHIKNHLREDQEVVCRICWKTAKEIIGEAL